MSYPCEGCGGAEGLPRQALDLVTCERRTAELCRHCLANPDAGWRWRLRVLAGDPARTWADAEHPDVRLSGQLAVRRAAQREAA